jgi:hypothetical protein
LTHICKKLYTNKDLLSIYDILGGVVFIRLDEDRVVEAYIGEYASGKSEMAINRAIELKNLGRKVNLVDLDTVEPFYTIRPLKTRLEELGINVIAFSSNDTFGLGETGAMLNPRARWALRNEGDVILDIGYGVFGAQTLNLVEGIDDTPNFRVIAVINYSRPMTNNRNKIREYILGLGRVDAIVANTHLGDLTTWEMVCLGNKEIIAVADELGLPVDYMGIDKTLKDQIKDAIPNVPIKFITRYMPGAMW